jgi:ammonia channel protein AmtB
MPNPASRTRAAARRRPAEVTAASGGLAGVVIALAAGDTVTAMVALIGFIPGAVSFVVERGGVRGLVADLWGRKPVSPEPEASPTE